MKVKILDTCGMGLAMFGARMSRGSELDSDSSPNVLGPADKKLAVKLVEAGDEHAKFARFVVSYIYINAPLYWWMQMATYRVGIEVLSSSTMYTLKEELQGKTVREARDYFSDLVMDEQIQTVLDMIDKGHTVEDLKANLPSGFLQSRMVMVSAQTLKRILDQRSNHKLVEWREFCAEIREQYPYKELL